MKHADTSFEHHRDIHYGQRSRFGKFVQQYIYHEFFGVGTALRMLNLVNKGINWKNEKRGLRLAIEQHAQSVRFGVSHGSGLIGLQKVLKSTYMPFRDKTMTALDDVAERFVRKGTKNEREMDKEDAFEKHGLTRLSQAEIVTLRGLEHARTALLEGMNQIEFSITRAAKAYPGSAEQRQHLEDARKLQQDFAGEINELAGRMREEADLYQRFFQEYDLIHKTLRTRETIGAVMSTGKAEGYLKAKPV